MLMRHMRSLSDAVALPERWQILLLTCRDPATDFRLPLAQELQALGHDIAYVFLRRAPILTEMACPDAPHTFSLRSFFGHIRARLDSKSSLLVINSTNLAFPILSNVLRNIVGGLWCFDMHDDLLYGSAGYSRMRAKLAQRLLLRGSDFIIHAAPTLQELFPASHHLGNASSIAAIARPDADFARILILASLDARLDFAFLSAAAAVNPQLSFHIHGQLSQSDPIVEDGLRTLTSGRPNVVYHGPYVNGDLPDLLRNYPVTLAPYITNSRLTRYIDPLRFYHCLNSGMEVISTDIPKARDLEAVLHIADAPEAIGALVERLRDRPETRRNPGSTQLEHNWRNRALKLLDLAAAVRDGRAGGICS